jgi:myosin-5
MPPKTTPGKKVNLSEIKMATWVKSGKLVWVELVDEKEGIPLNYAQGMVDKVMEDIKEVTILYAPKELKGPDQCLVTRIHERAEEPQIIDDLVDIEPLNDAELLRCLELRFRADLIYCYVGPTLLSTNPYKDKDAEFERRVYPPEDKEMFKRYALQGGKRISKPHIWNLSASTFWQLFDENRPQAICISGESGAGKSHGTRLCMSFVAQLFGSDDDKRDGKQDKKETSIENKILNCNPILEAFGNSKTIRNNDSSRFGKYFVMFVDKRSKHIKGAEVKNYLLEKSRVISQAAGERNYHIFYAVCKAMSPEKLHKYFFTDGKTVDMSEYNLLKKGGIYNEEKIDDFKIFNEVQDSFNNLGFTEEEQEGIWKVLSCVLNMGNIEIDSSSYVESATPCKFKGSKYLQRVLEILGVERESLEKGCCLLSRVFNNETLLSPRTPSQCENIRDSFCKDLFNNCFNWMVRKLNVQILPANQTQYTSIGFLDIFGFEDFEGIPGGKNSIEQFCINYTNEKLQKLFISYVFDAEKKIFEQEGLGNFLSMIKYVSNEPILNIFDKKPIGIYHIIDSVCKMNKDDGKEDMALSDQVRNSHNANEVAFFDKLKQNKFGIKHTAKNVWYTTDGFTEKNRDEFPPNLMEALQKADKTILRIFSLKLTDDEKIEDKKKDPQEKFLGFKFRQEMQGLMDCLEMCQCNFVRCIKPNEQKEAGLWVPELALKQVRYMGVLDSIKVRRESLPIRKPYKDFYAKYQDLDKISNERNVSFVRLIERPDVSWKSLTENTVKSVEKKSGVNNEVLFGKGRIFMSVAFVNRLEELLEECQKIQRVQLNKIADTFLVFDLINQWNKYRKTSLKVIGLSKNLLATWNSKIEYVKFKNVLAVTIRIQRIFRMTVYKRTVRLHKYSSIVIGRSFKLFKMREVLVNAKKKIHVLSSCISKMKFRIFMIRLRINRNMVESIFDKAWLIIQDRMLLYSSLTIQRIWRGFFKRLGGIDEVNKIKILREGLKKNRAALNIQRSAKGYLVRTRLDRMNRAAGFIQGFTRKLWGGKYLKMVQDSLIKIQRAGKKYINKMRIINKRNDAFNKKQRPFIDQVKTIEHDVIFHQQSSFYDLKNLENYTRVKFFDDPKNFRDYIPKLKSFIPDTPPIDLNPKVRLFSVLIDFDCQVDTSDIYKRSWAVDFLNLISHLYEKHSRLLHLEIGDSFSLAVDDDLKVYSWGLNDFGQLCRSNRPSREDNNRPKNCKILSKIYPRIISAGDDHTIMVDYSNDVYVWGDNVNGQFGLGHPRSVANVVQLKTLGNSIQSVVAKGNKNYLITESGDLYVWPNEDPDYIYTPALVHVSERYIKFFQISCGRNFAIGLSTNGLLFSSGNNSSGQLGLGDTKPRTVFTLIESLKSYGEKISVISCGANHSVCKTHTGKVFTWGLGSMGQLGNGTTKSGSIPIFIKLSDSGTPVKARSVQASVLSTYILLENKKIYHAGRISKTEKSNLGFKNFDFESKVFNGKLGPDFYPLKLCSKWSKSLSLTYLIVADFRKVKQITNIRDKVSDQINEKWDEIYNQVLPPYTDGIYKSICSKYIRKIYVLPETADGEKAGDKSKKGAKAVEKENSELTSTGKSRKTFDMGSKDFDKSLENLLEMKTRMVRLQQIPESKWTAQDRLLIKTINKL